MNKPDMKSNTVSNELGLSSAIRSAAESAVSIDEEEDNVTGIIKTFYRWLMPPQPTAKPEERHSWDKRLALTVFVLSLLMAFSIAVEHDLIPGIDGFARSAELSDVASVITGVRTDVHDLRVEGLSDQLFDTSVKLCHATIETDRQDYARHLFHLEQLYQKQTGMTYQSPACTQL